MNETCFDAIDLVEVAEELGFTVKRQNGQATTRCPATQHEHDAERPACGVWRGGFHCLKCETSGGVLAFVQAALSTDKAGAVEWLRGTRFLPESSDDCPAEDTLDQLARRRRWTRAALLLMGAEDNGDGEVRFPMRDAEGKVVGYRRRHADGSPFMVDGQEKKALTVKGGNNGLLGVWPIRDSGPVLLVEGEADCAAGLSANWPGPVVGTPGASPGRAVERALQKLLAGRDVVLAPDPGEVGCKWRDRLGRMLAGVQCRVSYIPPASDADLDKRLRSGEKLSDLAAGAVEWRDSASAAGKEKADKRDKRIQGGALRFPEIEPWAEAVGGAALLDGIGEAFSRYVALPPHGADTLALWVVFAHSLDAFQVAPRLALTSPVKQCGKTRTLTILQNLTPKALLTSNISSAGLFRTIEAARPTLLIDEGDSFLQFSDELRGILNSGHTRAGAFVIRLVGQDFEPRTFSTWAAMAFASIGRLPDTLADRSIILPMKRKSAGEKVERFRVDRVDDLCILARQAARWAADHMEALRAADPATPGGLNDRQADNWRVLLAIADMAGGEWPDRGRAAAVALCCAACSEDESRRAQLLRDIREVFVEHGGDRIASEDLCAALATVEDAPWAEWRHGKPITPAGVARLLKDFGIKSRTVRFVDRTAKGYLGSEFGDAFSRYLPPRSVTA